MLAGTVWVICMDLTPALQAISALREARDGADFVLLAPGVAGGLLRVLPAVEISFVMTTMDSCTCACRESCPRR